LFRTIFFAKPNRRTKNGRFLDGDRSCSLSAISNFSAPLLVKKDAVVNCPVQNRVLLDDTWWVCCEEEDFWVAENKTAQPHFGESCLLGTI